MKERTNPLLALLCRTGIALSMLSVQHAVNGQNLGFEPTRGADRPAWNLDRAGSSAVIDTSVARNGQASLRIHAAESRRGARFSGRIPRSALDGDRLLIRAFVRRDSAGALPGLWIRITGHRGLIYVDRVSAAEAPPEAWLPVSIEAPLSERALEIEFGGTLTGAGMAWFDDFSLTTARAEDLEPAPPRVSVYVDRALEIMDRHSLRRREIDWPLLRRSARNQARGSVTVDDAHLAVQFAVGELDDGHSYFMSPRQMSRLDEDEPVSNARTGRPSIEPSGERLETGAAYIHVPGFAGGSPRAQAAYATELQAIIGTLDRPRACGWVVDLRGNRGGNLWPMLAGLGPLLSEGIAGAALYPDASRDDFWYRDGKAGLGDYVRLRVHAPYSVEADAPVAVLTNGSTASAAEILTAAFRARPHTRSFGTPTRGAHTATRVFPLSDGAALVLAVAATSNRNGDIFEGPIEPDEHVAGTGPSPDSRIETPPVEAAGRWLAAVSECAYPAHR